MVVACLIPPTIMVDVIVVKVILLVVMVHLSPLTWAHSPMYLTHFARFALRSAILINLVAQI